MFCLIIVNPPFVCLFSATNPRSASTIQRTDNLNTSKSILKRQNHPVSCTCLLSIFIRHGPTASIMTDAIINKAKQISMVESKIADDTDKNLCQANVELRPFLDQTQRRTAHLNGCINTKARENAIDKRIDNKAMVKGMGARNRTFDQLPSAKKKNERVYLSRHQLVRTKTGSTKNTPGALAPSSTPVRNIAMTGKPKSSSILLVRTQNDSLRSSYGSTEHLRSRQMRRVSTSNSFLRHSASSTTSMQKNQTFEATLRQNQHTRRIAASASSLSLSGSLSSFTNVSFDKVCVREYNRCVGDNVPSKGPPIR